MSSVGLVQWTLVDDGAIVCTRLPSVSFQGLLMRSSRCNVSVVVSFIFRDLFLVALILWSLP